MAEFLYIDEDLEKLDPELRFLYVDSDGKLSNVSEEEEKKRTVVNVNESYKDNLLASLYSQIEFLRSELQEKNLLIRALLIRGISHFGLSRAHVDENLHQMEENRDIDSETTLSDSGISSYSNLSTGMKNGIKDMARDVLPTGNINGNINEVDILQKYLQNQLNELKLLKQKLNSDIDITEAENTEKIEIIPESPKPPKSPRRNEVDTKCAKKRKSQKVKENVKDNVPTKSIIVNKQSHDDEIWESGTHLIIGDNSILGIDEKRMGKKVKVRGFPGAVIRDFYAHLTPLLQHKPSFVTLMTCFNDTLHNESDKIFKDLINVKEYVENHLPECKVTVSCPEVRFGDDKIRETTIKLRKRLQDLNILQF